MDLWLFSEAKLRTKFDTIDISFGMYLWHMPFIILWLIIRKLFSEFYLSELLQISIFIIFIIVFSFTIFTFVEKPCRIKLEGYSEIKTGV